MQFSSLLISKQALYTVPLFFDEYSINPMPKPNNDNKTESTTKAVLNILHNKSVVLESLTLGTASALADALIAYPPYGYRYSIQESTDAGHILQDLNKNKSFYFNTIRSLYRGVAAYCAGSIPTFIIQNGVYKYLGNTYPHLNDPHHHFSFALLGGLVGAAVATPAGNIIFTQQKMKSTPHEAIQFLRQQGYTRLFRGMTPIMIREGIFSSSANYLIKLVRAEIKIHFNLEEGYHLDIVASSITGIVSSVVSQPVDRLATRLHANNQAKVSLVDSCTDMIKNEGIKTLWRGGFFRASSIVLSIFAVSITQREVQEIWDNRVTANKPR